MGQKNDYSVTVFLPNGMAKKWSTVNRLDKFAKFLNKKHSEWLYMNVYDHQNKQYLKRFYKGKLVPTFL
jgi:sRNA-binding regulator protein Hfq